LFDALNSHLVSKKGMSLAHELTMSRDHEKLGFYAIADGFVVRVYEMTQSLPVSERYGLQSHVRRAAVSTVTNIVEGCTRRLGKAYMQFLEIALGSACEVRYLLQLSARLKFLREDEVATAVSGYTGVINAIQAIISTIAAAGRQPTADSRQPIADSRQLVIPKRRHGQDIRGAAGGDE
jgi:four helix bundle protein